VFGRAGEKFRLQHVVDDKRMQTLITAGVIAVQFVTGRRGPAIGVDLVHVHLGVEVAEILPCREDIVEAMLELITERLLIT
jgi:hypothetical protein